MTKQEMFDSVYLGLASQGFKRSMTEVEDENGDIETVCAYRGEGGRRCAAGWLIKDVEYTPSMENKGISSLVDQGIVSLSPGSVALLTNLQDAHDRSYDPQDMRERLVEVALSYKLTVPKEE